LANKKLAKIDSTKIHINKDLVINRQHMTKFTNRAGVQMLKYKYYLLTTRDGSYRIGDPTEYTRIAKALNSPTIKFIRIKKEFINTTEIKSFKEEIGYIISEE